MRLLLFRLLVVTLALCQYLRAQVVINEVVNAASERALRWVGSVPRFGTGMS